jgi:UDP-N-acetylmuramoylalanine--D-glutamate ligase
MRALVLGLGESGMAMVRWLVREGWSVRVADTRESPPHAQALRAELPQVELASGAFSAALATDMQLVAISPGLSPQHSPARVVLEAARAQRIEVVGEIELFARALARLREERRYAPRVVGVTGTNGKTTTTRLAGLLIERAGNRWRWRATSRRPRSIRCATGSTPICCRRSGCSSCQASSSTPPVRSSALPRPCST